MFQKCRNNSLDIIASLREDFDIGVSVSITFSKGIVALVTCYEVVDILKLTMYNPILEVLLEMDASFQLNGSKINFQIDS